MQVNQALLVGMVISFALSYPLMLHLLDKYESYLEDRKMFKGYIGGFALAWVVYLFMVSGFIGFGVSVDATEEEISRDVFKSFWSIPTLALMVALLMSWLMNRPDFRGQMETSFYGTAMGFGFAATFAFIIISRSLAQDEIRSAYDFVFLIPLVLGIILLQGSVGSIIGNGCGNSELVRSFLIGSLLHGILNVLFFLRVIGLLYQEFLAVLALIYGIFMYMYVYSRLLPQSLPRSERMKLMRGQRVGPRKLGLGSFLAEEEKKEVDKKDNKEVDKKDNKEVDKKDNKEVDKKDNKEENKKDNKEVENT